MYRVQLRLDQLIAHLAAGFTGGLAPGMPACQPVLPASLPAHPPLSAHILLAEPKEWPFKDGPTVYPPSAMHLGECRKQCACPWHLQLGTSKENWQRHLRSRSCMRGHVQWSYLDAPTATPLPTTPGRQPPTPEPDRPGPVARPCHLAVRPGPAEAEPSSSSSHQAEAGASGSHSGPKTTKGGKVAAARRSQRLANKGGESGSSPA